MMLELIRKHEETDNDVYFLDVIGDRVVINDDYRGLKVLSTDLEPLMDIPVFDGWIIDRMYNSDRTDQAVFCCHEHRCFVVLDLAQRRVRVIEWPDVFSDRIPSPVYFWLEDEVIFADYTKQLFRLDWNRGEIRAVDPRYLRERSFFADLQWRRLRDDPVIGRSQSGEYIVKDTGTSDIAVVNRTGRTVQKIKDPKGPELDWHDLVFIQGMWIFVCEDRLCFVVGETRRQELHAESPHGFLRVTPFGKDHILVLRTNWSEIRKNQVSKYRLSGNWEGLRYE
jgi:hypothetical protein